MTDEQLNRWRQKARRALGFGLGGAALAWLLLIGFVLIVRQAL